ncbi:MAG: glycosyltransferase family 1 protein [Rikenellaceae bacterium]|nr:glycosyltransferase family 1 protein [Rikenellaceae bacterium]
MRALFIHFFDFAPHSGISKKILYQVEALRHCGLDVDLSYIEIDKDGIQRRMCGEVVIDNFGNGLYAKFFKWFKFSNLTKHILKERYDLIYIRSFYNTNPPLLRMLKRLQNAGIRVVMEYPTYPYDKETEGANLNYALIFWLNRIFRKRLPGHISRIVTFTDLEEIEGIPTIKISNGIDFNSIRLKTKRKESTSFNMIAVADIHYWHGFDRIIKGLGEYYKEEHSEEANLAIIGEGSSDIINSLTKLVSDYRIEKHVRFLGFRHGEELDNLFDDADFGIASLARHRSHITKIKTLKNREYAARGIPFIYSETDDDFDSMPYILKAPADDSPIFVKSIIDFHKSLKMSPVEIRDTIIGKLSWNVQMKRVADTIFNER